MQLIAIFAALQILITASLINLSGNPILLQKTKHNIGRVLGVQIAQETPPQDTTQPPVDSTTPQNTEPQPAVSQPQSTPADNSTPVDNMVSATPTPSSEQPNPKATLPTVSPEAQASTQPQESPGTSPSNQPQASPEVSPQEAAASPKPKEDQNGNQMAGESQTQAVLNGADLITSTDSIDKQSVEEAKKEEALIVKTTNPTEQTNVMINFAKDKVKDMDTFTKNDDFTSANFAATRFNNLVDQSINNLEKVPKKDLPKVQKNVEDFCRQADEVLRTVELSVPQESEQDIQMARGQCFELNQ